MKKFRYKTILMQGTLQYAGYIVEYFIENTEKLIVYYVMPRGSKESNMVRLYSKGKKIHEKELISSGNIVLCYLFIYLNFLSILFGYFKRGERFFLLSAHPIFFFFRSILKLFRVYECVYFVGDYYPGKNLINIFYRIISQHYHNGTSYRTYITNRLNRKMNGKIINNAYVKTMMWGVKMPKKYKQWQNGKKTLCFIGAIRESHGLQLLFDVLKERKDLNVKILGTCEKDLFRKYKERIGRLGIADQVYFPNTFIKDLERETKDSYIGIALYDVMSGTHYADPGKVKAYAQLAMPIVMTYVSETARYIKRFKAGEIVEENVASVSKAIDAIFTRYDTYVNGLKRFNRYFNSRTYYVRAYKFLENI